MLMDRSQFMKYLDIFSGKAEALEGLCRTHPGQQVRKAADIKKTENRAANLFKNDIEQFADFIIN